MFDELINLKNSLRREMKELREALSEDFRRLSSLKIADFCEMLPVSSSDCIGLYMPLRSECDVMPLAERMARKGCRLALPVVVEKEQPLIFRHFDDTTILKQGFFGVFEPSSSSEKLSPTVFLTPLLAFDEKGGRLGYGAGFYDRTFKQNNKALRIGIAFSCQQVEKVPMEPTDVLLDMILTEKGLIKVK